MSFVSPISAGASWRDLPCRLTLPGGNAEMPRPPAWLLAGLLLLCLAPRAALALKLTVLCPDAVFYIEMAQSLERGEVTSAVEGFHFNVFPHILVLLHRAGCDWESAGKWWGVCCASLTILPLFGWLRRQFNWQVSAAGCALYALHPKLIEWSPEVVRDPTFWLLFALSLYFSWRAAAEARPIYFAVAGIATTLAVHTRFEGWFLTIPLLLWTIWRGAVVGGDRPRLALGAALFIAAFPVILAAINLTVLRNADGWDWGNFERLDFVRDWAESLAEDAADESRSEDGPLEPTPHPAEVPSAAGAFGCTPSASPRTSGCAAHDSTPHDLRPSAGPMLLFAGGPLAWAAQTPVQSASAHPNESDRLPRTSTRRAAGKLALTLWRGFTLVHGLLMLLGLCFWWRMWLRRDVQPLFLLSVIVLAGMWVHLMTDPDGGSSSRYTLSLVIISCSYFGLGLLEASRLVVAFLQRFKALRLGAVRWGSMVCAVLLALVAAASVGEVFSDAKLSRRQKADLGRWILQQRGPGRSILTPRGYSLITYYARGVACRVPIDGRMSLRKTVARARADVVVLPRRRIPADGIALLLERKKKLKLEAVPADMLPATCRKTLVVLLRQPPGDRTRVAERPFAEKPIAEKP